MSYNRDYPSKIITPWLLLMVVLVAAMIVIGGATRLTNSGLSITEWAPIRGALPPLSEAKWLSEFEKYKLIPEFMAEHPGMDLAAFKFIYFWEWGHRQLGRIIGLAFAVPFFVLLARKRLPQGKVWWFWVILVLIGLQGVIGWWMVASGLVDDRVSVSQYRLATHLGMAFIILGLLFSLLLDSLGRWKMRIRAPLRVAALGLLVLVWVQIIAGAFVAGLHAGRTYNTWPLMDGDIIPAGYLSLSPAWRNIFENIAAVQFNHRTLAYCVLIGSVWLWLSARKRKFSTTQRASGFLLIAILWQVALGIWTLLSAAPLNLALAHQASSIIVFLLAVWTAWTATDAVSH